MLHTHTERLPVLPLIFSAQPGDPPPPGEEGDPPPPGDVKIKPPTVNQPASSESVADIKPPTATDEPATTGDTPIVISGG